MLPDHRTKALLEKIGRKEKAFGCHIVGNDPQQTELLADMGFDYLWIDTEHSAIDQYTLLLHLTAARAGGPPCFVRIPWNDPVLAKPILDMGVQGLIFPMVDTAKDAERAVKSCLYPPRGTRGYAPRRAIRFGLDPADAYIAESGDRLIKLIQIETREAVENLEAIAAVPGVDILVLGPMDLSGAYGKLGQVMDPGMQETYRSVASRAHAAGKPILVSFGGYSRDHIRMWAEMGMDLITAGSEMGFIVDGARAALKNAKDAFAPR